MGVGADGSDPAGSSAAVSGPAVSQLVPASELREGDWVLVDLEDGTQAPCRLGRVCWFPLDLAAGPVVWVSSDALRWAVDERVRRIQSPDQRV